MTKPRDPEALLSAYLAGGMEVLPDRVVDSVLDEVHRTRQRAVVGRWRTRSTFRLAFGAVAVIAALAIGGALLAIQRGQPAIGGPSPTPSADPSASLQGVVAPSSSPSGLSAAPTSSANAHPSGVWIATGRMATAREGHTAVRLLDGRVLVAGGFSGGASSLTSAELYDPNRGTWSATGTMAMPVDGFPATLLRDGKVLMGVVGDPDADDSMMGAEVYDPATGSWTATGKMVLGGGVATLLRDGRVLVTGNDGSELYDPDSGTWAATGTMTTPRHSHAAVLLPDGKVLVAGGHAPGDSPTDAAELYDPDTGTWTAIADMHAKREVIEAILQPDGKVLVVGGSDRGNPQTVELYDPAAGVWTASGDMSRPGISADASATLLSTGMVLVRAADSPEADLYDPRGGSWSTTGNMLRSHSKAPATLLLDGTVLVAGGHKDPGVATGSTESELYVPAGVSPPPA